MKTNKAETKKGQESRVLASGFKVYCRYDAILHIGKIKPNPENPNKHPARQIEMLARIIREQGWRNPITISRRSGLIVRGHGRLEAAKMLNAAEVPVEYQSYTSKEAETADMIADNKISELSKMSDLMLKPLVLDLKAASFDITLSGIDSQDLMDIVEEQDDKGKTPTAQTKFLKFLKIKMDEYRVDNTNNEHIADLKYMRSGKFMHWHFCPAKDTLWTNGCLKEVSAFMKKLHNDRLGNK